MTYRIARSLAVLRDQCNQAWPARSIASDGWIGDPSHSSRESDHNPDPLGIVRAIDITHDPEHGADMNALAESLRSSQDPRISYVIWNRRIFSSTLAPWTWRSYSGTNPHDHHIHVSVVTHPAADAPRKWRFPEGKDWFDMADEKDLERVVRKVVQEEVNAAIAKLAVGKTQAKKGYDSDKVNIKAAIK